MFSPLTLGFTTGLLISVPLDSGSLEAINRGIQRGFLSSFLVGLGGVIGDLLCFSVLAFGFALYIERYPFLSLYTAQACVLFLFLAGVYYLMGDFMTLPKWRLGKAHFVVLWLSSPFLFGLISSLLTPTTMILTAPFCELIAEQKNSLMIAEFLAGLLLGGIIWSILLAYLSVKVGKRVSFHFKIFFRKIVGLFYISIGITIYFWSL